MNRENFRWKRAWRKLGWSGFFLLLAITFGSFAYVAAVTDNATMWILGSVALAALLLSLMELRLSYQNLTRWKQLQLPPDANQG